MCSQRPSTGRAWSRVAVVFLAAAAGPAHLVCQERVRITVVATTDVHGNVLHWNYWDDRAAPSGLTRAATFIDSLRHNEDGELLLVDAGDFFQGSPFATYFGSPRNTPVHPIVDTFNALMYDAVTLGEHDLDFGIQALDTALSGALFQVLAANYYSRELETPVYRDYVSLERHGIRVGLTGVTTPGSARWHSHELGNTREVRRVEVEAERALSALDEQAVDLKVVLMHGGLGRESSYDTSGVGPENDAEVLATLAPKPALVIVGHSHGPPMDTVVGGVHFVRPPPHAEGLAVIRIDLARNDDAIFQVAHVATEFVTFGETLPPDEAVTRRLNQSHRAVRSWANTPLGTAGAGWSGQLARAEDTPLMDLVTETMRRRTNAQLAAATVYNLDAGFPVGEVRRRHVLALYPQEHSIDVVSIDGASLREYLERAASYYDRFVGGSVAVAPDAAVDGFDVVSGLDYVIDLSMPVGSRVRQLVYQGDLVQPTDRFTMAVADYRRRGGGGYDMLNRLPVVTRTGISIREALANEVQEAGTLDVEQYYQPNWRIIPSEAAMAARTMYGGAPTEERTVLRVLATADFQGAVESRLTEWSGERHVGGAVAVGAWVDSLARDCHCATVVVDAGNQLHGSLDADASHGRAVVEAFNAIGYDAANVGGDDLWWGADSLRARVGESHYAWLSTNAKLKQRSGVPDWVHDWVVVERGGLKIGVLGVTTTEAAATSTFDAANTLAFDDAAAAIRRAVPAIRAAGAKLVVLLAHASMFCDADGCEGDLVRLAQSLPPGTVDLIVGGHSDTEASAIINGFPVLLPGSYGLSLGLADFVALPTGGIEVRNRIETVWSDIVAETAPPSLQILARPATTAGAMDETVARLKFPVSADALSLSGDSGPETSMLRLTADAYRFAARAQIAVVFPSAVHDGLPAGVVTMAHLYKAVPAADPIVRVQLRGADLVGLLEEALGGDAPRVGVSDIKVEFDPSRRPGHRVRSVAFTDGRDIDRDREYAVALSATAAREYVGSVVARDAVEDVGSTELDALAGYLKRLPQPVDVPARPRVIAK